MSWAIVWDLVEDVWPHLVGMATLLVDLAAMAHVVLKKRDTRSAIGWVGIIWLVPILGVVLYVLLGINRVQRRAVTLRRGPSRMGRHWICRSRPARPVGNARGGPSARPSPAWSANLTDRPLLEGNDVLPLVNGDEAYPEMLRAIGEAQKIGHAWRVYIFDNDRAGRMFAEALGEAVAAGRRRAGADRRRRGAVQLALDRTRAARSAGVRMARFLPTFAARPLGLCQSAQPPQDHGRRRARGFYRRAEYPRGALPGSEPGASDPGFALSHSRAGRRPFAGSLLPPIGTLPPARRCRATAGLPTSEQAGTVLARGITTGPDGDLDKLRLALLGAIACAETSISIVSPYFLPDETLIAALERGGAAGRAGRHRAAGQEQSVAGPMGLDRPAVASARTRLPGLADAAAVRPCQTDGRRPAVDAVGLGQLGRRAACG